MSIALRAETIIGNCFIQENETMRTQFSNSQLNVLNKSIFLFPPFCEKSSEIVFYILSKRFCVLFDAVFLICNNFVYFVPSKRTERYKVNATWVVASTAIGISNQNNAFVLAGKLVLSFWLSLVSHRNNLFRLVARSDATCTQFSNHRFISTLPSFLS